MKNQPPRAARALLRRFCDIEFLEEIEGDLDEQFEEHLAKLGAFRARIQYWRNVLTALLTRHSSRTRRDVKRSLIRDTSVHLITISIRHIRRGHVNLAINATGLAVSLACFIFIAIYVINQSSFDTLHPNPSRVYRISTGYQEYGTGTERVDARAPGLWAFELRKAMPGIVHSTRMSRFGYAGTVRNDKRGLLNIEPQFFWVDSTYTDIFALPMKAGGDPRRILSHSGQVIISTSMATKYFGNEVALGQTLIYSRDGLDILLIVAGVMNEYPSNVHFHPDFISSNLALTPLWNRHGVINSSYSDGHDRVNSWRDTFTYSYVELSPTTTVDHANQTLRHVLKTNLGEDAKFLWPVFVPLLDIHFQSSMQVDLESSGDRAYLFIFGSIGIFILLIACINYMNMATAKSVARAREVGIRKTLGVRRGSLILQFIGESVIMASIAMCLSMVIVLVLLPTFRELTGCSTSFRDILRSQTLAYVGLLTFAVGILSGIYPAVFLSGFRPLNVLKGMTPAGGYAERFRRVLVVFQFTVTLILVVGTFVIRQQLSYINTAKVSQFKDQILTVQLHGLVNPNLTTTLAGKINRTSAVVGTSLGTQIPRQDRFPSDKVKLLANETSHTWELLHSDFEFANLFELEFIAGRNFSANNPADSNALLINQAALEELHMTAPDAIGLVLEEEMSHGKGIVIGVVKDFTIGSLRHRIEPLVIEGHAQDPEVMYVKLAGNDYPGAIDAIHNLWKEMFPGMPFQHWFLNEEFDKLYYQEQTTGTLFTCFAGLAILVASLGLLGLTTYTVEQKTREIGIRKVLGATGVQILALITGRFVRLVLVAVAIGLPLSWYLAQNWLARFAYQVVPGWAVFGGSAVLLLITTCLTVSIESMQAALRNPADALRHES